MTNQNDPVSQIKKVEESEAKRFEKASADLELKLRKTEKEFEDKTAEFEDSLREKGNEKLGTVKIKAGEILKSKMAATETEVARLDSDSEKKLDSAVKEISEDFLSYIKA